MYGVFFYSIFCFTYCIQNHYDKNLKGDGDEELNEKNKGENQHKNTNNEKESESIMFSSFFLVDEMRMI